MIFFFFLVVIECYYIAMTMWNHLGLLVEWNSEEDLVDVVQKFQWLIFPFFVEAKKKLTKIKYQ